MPEDEEESRSNGHSHPNPELVTETDYSPPRGKPFPIVGIGASAGGLEAFAELLAAVPENTGAAFVLVQHLDPQHESLLTDLLAPSTRMPVITVHDGIEVDPDHVYVIPPNSSMELKDGSLRLVGREPGLHLPIDIFFRSLARVQGSRAVGVVLSGNASDGSLGVRAIKAECGLTFAQDEGTARFGGMPRNAAATGAVDFIMSPADIGRELGRLGQHPFLIAPRVGVAESEILPEGDGEFGRVLSTLHAATKVDFSQYKPTTIRRRIGRRMMILRVETLADYARYLHQKPSELFELYKDLLISVTSFFRDPPTFEALVRHLQSSIAAREDRDSAIRVWVSGCATGEEVYSLAIRLHEFLHDQNLALPLQLFGTDISETALQRARQGTYSSIIVDDVSEERLRRFFTKIESGYQVNKMIREACIFARHDVTKDPPFSRLDIVSCRNVLIYLDAKAQRRVLPTFHYALNPSGLLMLGSAETTVAAADLFKVVDKAHHIYSRKPVPSRLILELTAGRLSPDPAAARPEAPARLESQKRLERVIQNRYSPDAVVVSPEMQILQFRGHTAAYLDPSPGEATLNLLRMARENLVMPLRRVLQRAMESDAVVREGVTVDIEGRTEEVTLEVTPVSGSSPEDRCFLIVFVRAGKPSAAKSNDAEFQPPPSELFEHAASLERELTESREYLRQLTEQYEAHAEELRAANEEARSANEELQSTNEELGTTKEELQSANEELTTVNEELQNRNQELAAANSDMRNLLAAVSVAIVMVDQDLRVRRFNPAAEKLLELGAIDVGRPVGHLRGRIETPRLEGQVKRVIETLSPVSEELQDAVGCWYTVGVRPYRTVDDRIAGAVITFQEIDSLKRGLAASEEARQYAEALIETVREPLVVLDADLRVQRATPAFYETFLVSREECEGRHLYDLGNGQWNRPRLRELLGLALFRSEPFHDFEFEHDFPHIGRRTMRLNARRIPRRDPEQRTLLLAIEDVTERREIAEIRFQRLFETAKDAILVVDAETEVIEDANSFFFALSGVHREDVVGRTAADAGRRLSFPELAGIVAETRHSEIVRREDARFATAAGGVLNVDVIANRYTVGTQPVVQLNIRDITSRKEAANALIESENRFRIVVESLRDYAIFQLDAAGRIVGWNTGAERLLGWQESEILGMPVSVVFTPEDRAAGEDRKEFEKAMREGRAEDERWHMRKDGTRFFASGVLTRVAAEDGSSLAFTKIMQDVTGRKEQEERLQQSVEEKSILLREIHHRVKNNLQVIVSLLSLQASHTEDSRVLAAFDETKGRVRAIAQIHEQLYATEDLREVEIGAYLAALARELVGLHATVPDGVRLRVAVPEMVLPIEKAIPVGLIANELLMNSLKYGFPAGSGDLSLSLEFLPEGNARLSVKDNGPGFPPDFDPSRSGSMGFRLVNLLVRQLRAGLELGSAPGATVTITFPIADTPLGGGE